MLLNDQPEIYAYCEKHSTRIDPVLNELERQTHLNTLSPQMISGVIQGRLLDFISHISKPKLILEIGSFTGYAALCLTESVDKNTCLYTLEVKNEYDDLINNIASKSEHFHKIKWIKANALEWLPNNPHPWDLVFLDAGKQDYLKYLDILENQMNPGSILITDNVLWYGKVLSPVKDKETQTLHDYNVRISNSPKWKSFLLPLRDGLQLSIRTNND
jgi:caffeoyl-CoA O-methyltransferase